MCPIRNLNAVDIHRSAICNIYISSMINLWWLFQTYKKYNNGLSNNFHFMFALEGNVTF